MLKFTLSTAFIILSSQAFALVDMKNANYTQGFVDLEVPGSGFDLKIFRQYQSRSLHNGIFGFGWCSEFETSLEVNAEGNVKITECGAGQEITFSQKEVTKKDIDASIAQIVAKMKLDKKLSGNSEKYFKEQAVLLFSDDQLRSTKAKEYSVSAPIKEGTKFMANGREVESIVYSKGFYTRNMADGSTQRFSADGHLTHLYNKNSDFLKFEYDKDVIKEITDNNARRLTLKYFANKKVKTVTGPNGMVAEYKYSNQDDLIWVKNAYAKKATEVYTYEYNEFHNLTKATYPDKTFVALKYDNLKDWVLSFTDREKCVENYTYEFSKSDPRFHYWSTVKKTCANKVVADNRFEFWHKQRDDGMVVLERVVTRVGNVNTDVTYHDVFGKPIFIRRNKEKMNFEYYPDGLVKMKLTGNIKTEFQYDDKIRKPSKVTLTVNDDKGKKVVSRFTSFKYDPKGNLTYAENSDGQKVTMTYDNKGRMSSILDQAKKFVKIEYEEKHGKPAVVSRPGLGTIKVFYKPSGEIQKVDSPEGPIVATQVASAFNNMLDIISPATEELYL